MSAVNFQEDAFFKEAFCLPKDFLMEVKYQGGTNSCYAFVVTNCIHADLRRQGGLGLIGSQQELLDCLHEILPPSDFDPPVTTPREGYANTLPNALEYIKLFGLKLDENYKWKEGCGKCQRDFSDENHVISIGNYKRLYSIDEVIQTLSKNIAVTGIIVSTETFSKWSGIGIYTYDVLSAQDKVMLETAKKIKLHATKQKVPHHAITLIGYGDKNGVKYFLVQNSYGTKWGYRGYIKIARELVDEFYFVEGSHLKHKATEE